MGEKGEGSGGGGGGKWGRRGREVGGKGEGTWNGVPPCPPPLYTLFALIYDLLNISLKSLILLTITFYEWNMSEDSPGYILLPLMCMNTSR